MNKIITISREFGSGGRELGKRLAEKLGFAYYDSEIIRMLVKETGKSEEYIKNISEKGIYPYAFQFAKSFSIYGKMQKEQTEFLVAQQKVLKQIAEKKNAVIVGRGADVILKEYDPINIFVYANIDSKIARCRKKGNDDSLTDKELIQKIKEIDKERIKYHNIISNVEWGKKENYHLCINTTELNIKDIISPLADYVENLLGRDDK